MDSYTLKYLFSLAADWSTSFTSCEVQSEEKATCRRWGREGREEREGREGGRGGRRGEGRQEREEMEGRQEREGREEGGEGGEAGEEGRKGGRRKEMQTLHTASTYSNMQVGCLYTTDTRTSARQDNLMCIAWELAWHTRAVS